MKHEIMPKLLGTLSIVAFDRNCILPTSPHPSNLLNLLTDLAYFYAVDRVLASVEDFSMKNR